MDAVAAVTWTRGLKVSVIQRAQPVESHKEAHPPNPWTRRPTPSSVILAKRGSPMDGHGSTTTVDAEGSPPPPSSSRSGDPPRRGNSPAVDAGTQSLRHSEDAGNTPVSDANPAKRIAAEKEEQGSGLSFRREAEAKLSGLCDDAIPPLVPPG